MKRYLLALVLLALVLSTALVGCQTAPKVDWELQITGAVNHPLTLSYRDLVKRDQVTLENILMQRSKGEDTTNTWVGPALKPILEEAGISSNATAVICSASDGYAKKVPLEDAYKAIIALKKDGEWIASRDKGPIRIVIPGRPANFWVAQLIEIKVVEE